MNDRMHDAVTWDHLPHPDPKATPGYATVHVPPAFWSRLRQHVQDAHGTTRSLWEAWLSAGVVTSLGRIDAVRVTGRPEGEGTIPASAVERLRDTVARSLESPLALCFRPGATLTSRPSRSCLYHLILTNGATLTLRGDPTRLEVEDCFFTRAALETAESPDGMWMNGRGDATSADAARRRAVVAEVIRRYARVDDDKRFALPGESSLRGRGLPASRRAASFLRPLAWGFTGTEPGSHWTGKPGPDEMDSAAFEQSMARGNGNHRDADMNPAGPRRRNQDATPPARLTTHRARTTWCRLSQRNPAR